MREAVAAIKQQATDDRNTACAKYILAELQALPEKKANVLRMRLSRTVLEFSEQEQQKEESQEKQYLYVVEGENITEVQEIQKI